MAKLAVVLLVLFGLGCQSSGEGSQDGSGSGAPMVGGWGGTATGAGGSGAGTGGMVPAPGGPGGGSPGGVTPDASAGGMGSTVDTGECPFSMAGKACAPNGANCAWHNDCVARRCDCLNGTWTCTERQTPCGGMCPAPQDARCGDACTGGASGCLCRSGGGPNYAGCSCTGGRWQCAGR